MAAHESLDWQLGKASKQSITELLHNPRAPALELSDVTFDLSATPLTLTPLPVSKLPNALDINHFEPYLRRYASLYHAYRSKKLSTPPVPAPLSSVPSHYFSDHFSLASADLPLNSAEPLGDNPQIPRIKLQIADYQNTLQHHLKVRLEEQAPELSSAIQYVRDVRSAILHTASQIRASRENAAVLLPTITTPISTTRRLTLIKENLVALKEATSRIHLVISTPADVTMLLETGDFAPAIDAVQAARDALRHPYLSSLHALSPLHNRLSESIESINHALRRQFRLALTDADEPTLHDVVHLVARMDRISHLYRFFMREVNTDLAQQLEHVSNLQNAAQAIRASASRALMLISIIHHGQHGIENAPKPQEKRRECLRQAHIAMEDMLSVVIDRLLGSFSVQSMPDTGFIVITPPNILTGETCFDEFKAAFKFGEHIRLLKDLEQELEQMFSSDGKRNSTRLRAKISERQIRFLSAFHKAHMETLTVTMQSDKWQQVRISEPTLRLLNALTEDPPNSTSRRTGNGANEQTANSSPPSEVAEDAVVIGSQSFKTVSSGVRYLRSICAYTLLAEKSPYLASEIARRGAEYSRHFNSLVGKAILGAAALKWAGVRSITARHLSLASRTIAMAVALSEKVNSSLEEALSGPQVDIIVPLIRKSGKDLRDHHGQLLAKILAIMMDRLDAHETVLKSLPWDKAQEMHRFVIPSDYIVTLSREATILHRILWSILPQKEVSDVFQRVCAAYGTHLTEAYGCLNGGKRWIRNRVAKDVECLHEKLLQLEVFKANPDSFKPLAKLYNRFSKEYSMEDVRKTTLVENGSDPKLNQTARPNGKDTNLAKHGNPVLKEEKSSFPPPKVLDPTNLDKGPPVASLSMDAVSKGQVTGEESKKSVELSSNPTHTTSIQRTIERSHNELHKYEDVNVSASKVVKIEHEQNTTPKYEQNTHNTSPSSPLTAAEELSDRTLASRKAEREPIECASVAGPENELHEDGSRPADMREEKVGDGMQTLSQAPRDTRIQTDVEVTENKIAEGDLLGLGNMNRGPEKPL